MCCDRRSQVSFSCALPSSCHLSDAQGTLHYSLEVQALPCHDVFFSTWQVTYLLVLEKKISLLITTGGRMTVGQRWDLPFLGGLRQKLCLCGWHSSLCPRLIPPVAPSGSCACDTRQPQVRGAGALCYVTGPECAALGPCSRTCTIHWSWP